jgi:anti-sigma regulatory factor (Ser/Thr protein kinase)
MRPSGRIQGGTSIQPERVIERLDLRVVLGPDASGTARAALRSWGSGHLSDDVLDDAQLLLSELVTNGLRHAGLGTGDMLAVRASIDDGLLRVEVENPGMVGEVAPRPPDLDGAGGFGLQLVDALTDRWGVIRDGGTCVWAEMAWQRTG